MLGKTKLRSFMNKTLLKLRKYFKLKWKIAQFKEYFSLRSFMNMAPGLLGSGWSSVHWKQNTAYPMPMLGVLTSVEHLFSCR